MRDLNHETALAILQGIIDEFAPAGVIIIAQRTDGEAIIVSGAAPGPRGERIRTLRDAIREGLGGTLVPVNRSGAPS